ncbi:MAG: hypothetical protein KAS19_10375 [Anaerolineales bacterium]|nr:hypothetical protein [Anaerolineales bacterium]
MLPELTDITSLGLLAFVLYMGYKMAETLLEGILEHIDRQSEILRECSESLLIIKESLQNLDKN